MCIPEEELTAQQQVELERLRGPDEFGAALRALMLAMWRARIPSVIVTLPAAGNGVIRADARIDGQTVTFQHSIIDLEGEAREAAERDAATIRR